jgi:exodeoxyribonuclease V gamma subunit
VKEGEKILEGLLRRYWEGLREPLRFFPEASWEYAQHRLAKEKPPEAALEEARQTWQGSKWSRGESQDPSYQLCFGKENPLGCSFEEIAVEIFDPLLKCLKKE